jgi:hypothetical protein
VEQKRICVDMAGDLLRSLSDQTAHQWHDIVTLRESWIYLYTEHEITWAPCGEPVPDQRAADDTVT